MDPSGIKIGKEQLNVFAYADDFVLIGKKWNRNKNNFFVETENIARKFGLHINQGKTKYITVKWKKKVQNKIEQQ